MISVDVRIARDDFVLETSFRSEAPVLGVFGPSGAGKTTLIHALAGLMRPDEGTIALNGRTLFDAAGGVDVRAQDRNVGVVFQEHRLFPHYSVAGNLMYGAGHDRSKLEAIVDLLELRPLLDRRIAQLSGGEQQRVGLGRALLSHPQLLLLDEPLASLDRRLRQQILPYLRRIPEVVPVPVLYVSHELDEILQLTDEILVLDEGRVIGHGPYRDVVHDDAVLAVVHDRGMTNMLRARVVEHHPQDGISTLTIGDRDRAPTLPSTTLAAPIVPQANGEMVTIALQPWDIALAARRIGDVSIQNQVRGVVKRCTMHERRALVEIDIGESIIAEVSRRSAMTMNLEPDREIVCLIKSHAIRSMGGGTSAVAQENALR